MIKTNNNNHKKRKLRLDIAGFFAADIVTATYNTASVTDAATYGASVYYAFAGGASHRYLRQIHFAGC